MKQFILSHHLQKLLLLVVTTAFSFSTFAQSAQVWIVEKEKQHEQVVKERQVIEIISSCRSKVAPRTNNSILALEMELSNLQSFKAQARRLKRKIRAKKRELKRKEAKLIREINGIEDYVKVDERLTKRQISNYSLQVDALSLQLMQTRADKRKVNRLYRRAKRLLRSNYYNYNYRCGTESYYRRHRSHHHHNGPNPWWIAFATLFSINVLVGGIIAYRTLRK
ncbi:MAG TPA: hypothetical protein DCS93_00305 [Microscillaceae bacterium]|nr:hypothetical protein [Microscillaceae bacterium]